MSKISSNRYVNSTILLMIMTKTISRKIRQFQKYETVRLIVTTISYENSHETFLNNFKTLTKIPKKAKMFFEFA